MAPRKKGCDTMSALMQQNQARPETLRSRRPSRDGDPHLFSGRGLGLFLWEYFIITLVCYLFIIFTQNLAESRDPRTAYSFYLFHIVFPPVVFGLVTWATGSFKPGRTFFVAVFGALTLFAFFPIAQVLGSLWVLMLCLNLAYLFQLVGVPSPMRRKRKVTMSTDPADDNLELRRSRSNERRRFRKTRTATKHARPIPLGRFWPKERI